jgi:hypothetical protein
MSTDRQVLKEFLVSLGFQLDQSGLKKFTGGVNDATKSVMKVGAAVIGAAAAVEEFVKHVSQNMEKLYYASQRTGATVGSLQALQQAAEKTGLQTNAVTAAVEGFADALRRPGFKELLGNLGVNTAQADKTKEFFDLMERLRDMAQQGPAGFAVAEQFAGQFGIGPDTFLQMTNNLDRFRAEYQKSIDLQRESGQNLDKFARDSQEMMNIFREIEDRFGKIGARLTGILLPAVEKWGRGMKVILDDATQLLRLFEKSGWMDKLLHPIDALFGKTQPTAPTKDAQGRPLIDVSGLNSKYNLPPGLLRALVQTESHFNPRAESFKGAQYGAGLTQLSEGTARQYGVKDRYDPQESLEGGAHYLSDLIEQFHDLKKGVAAYNYGPRHIQELVDRYGEKWQENLPRETAEYLVKVLGAASGTTLGDVQARYNSVGAVGGAPIAVSNHTNIHVTGSGDPAATGRAVANEQSRTFSDTVREFKSAFSAVASAQ